MAVLSNGSLSFRGMLVVGGGASFMTPWQPVDLRTGVMNDAPPPISPARIESQEKGWASVRLSLPYTGIKRITGV